MHKKKILSGCTQMIIEVKVNVIREVMTRTSILIKLRAQIRVENIRLKVGSIQ